MFYTKSVTKLGDLTVTLPTIVKNWGDYGEKNLISYTIYPLSIADPNYGETIFCRSEILL